MRHTRCFGFGLFFAVIQYFYFLNLESGLAATMTVYMSVVFSWLTGTLVGLRLRRVQLKPIHVLISLGAYFINMGVVAAFPFEHRFIPLYMVCVGISGVTVGLFFRSYARHFRDAKALFFSENNGFILGLFVALWGFLTFGRPFMVSFPVLLAGVLMMIETAGRMIMDGRSYSSVGSPARRMDDSKTSLSKVA